MPSGLRVLLRVQLLEDADGLWRFHSRLSRRTRLLAGIPEELDERGFLERMAEVVGRENLYRFVCLIVSPEEEIVGYFGIDVKDEDARTGWVFFVVQDSYRGKGIGKEIMSYVVDEASSLGLEALRLQVLARNERAMRLFETFGFEREGEWFDPEAREFSITMFRSLSSSRCTREVRGV